MIKKIVSLTMLGLSIRAVCAGLGVCPDKREQ